MHADLEQAGNWYVVTLDGLRHLGTAVHTRKSPQHLTEQTLEQIRFITEIEWAQFLREREDEHEMYASLALLATCEGGIRRDAEWRGSINAGQNYFFRFQALLTSSTHVSLHTILDAWQAALGSGHPFRRGLDQLRALYRDRNLLAHGRAHLGQYAFDPIYEKLASTRRKWSEFVDDFKGF